MKPLPVTLPLLASLLLAVALTPAAPAASGLRLARENPRYLEWHGAPVLVVGSGEHYGAVLNADFDFERYLQTLQQDGLNHTRLFTGATYVEPAGAFNIERNTLAPGPGRYLAPWARSREPGYAGGGNRFDLDHWNEDYFTRLRSFVTEAGRNGVIVEVNLFCPFYDEAQWVLSPFHPGNNINGVGGGLARTNVYTLDRHGGLLPLQERFVRRVVAELKAADNVYYEVCNEPYFGGVTLDWQAHIARTLESAQASHRPRKLISQNIANGRERVARPIPEVAIFNFHYAHPPDTVGLNADLQRPIGDNETGFAGTADYAYRIEAWDFLLAGGALFSHLDYSFTAGHEDGTFAFPPSQPGGGGPELRRQLGFLRHWLSSAPFTRLAPNRTVVGADLDPKVWSVRCLAYADRFAVAYFHPAGKPGGPQSPEFSLRVAPGVWTADWFDPRTGDFLGRRRLDVPADGLRVQTPPFEQDLALRLRRR